MINDVVNLGFSLNQLLDRTEVEAVAMCEAAGRKVRISNRDGKSLMLTQELSPSRVNLSIVDGIVSSYSLG